MDGLVPATTLGIMATVGIAAASVSTLAPLRAALVLFLVLMVAPQVWATLWVGAAEGYAIAFMAGAGLVFLISIGLRMNREYWANLYRAQLLDERAMELVLARDAAVAADRAKSDFLAKMSHEIRTPLNGVLGMTEVLRATKLDRHQGHLARLLQQSAESLLIVIDDILDFSKIEAGKFELEVCEFNLEDLVDETLELLGNTAARKGLELLVDYSPDLETDFLGDPTRLRQIVNNLVSNGLKFTEEGEVLIRISRESEDETATIVRFEVHDTGIGLSPDAQRQIFDRFYQAEDSTTRKYGGTGLGLAIVKEVVELMQGDIGVASERGEGASFWFTARLERSKLSALGARAEPVRLAGKRVLVADDNVSSREILEDQMRALGLSVTVVEGGLETLAALESGSDNGRPFDLVLLDREMPEPDGAEVARRLVRGGSTSKPPMIMLSPMGQLECCPDGLELEIFACITKPVRRRNLRRAVLEALGAEVPAAQVASPDVVGINDTRSRLAEVRILLVEDDSVNRIVAEEMLRSLGGRPTIVETGKEAVEEAAAAEYDIVLMDCQMPEMDGYEATRRIRRDERQSGRRRVSIVALTADASAGARERAIQSGMDAFLNKPYQREALGNCLVTTLESRG